MHYVTFDIYIYIKFVWNIPRNNSSKESYPKLIAASSTRCLYSWCSSPSAPSLSYNISHCTACIYKHGQLSNNFIVIESHPALTCRVKFGKPLIKTLNDSFLI